MSLNRNIYNEAVERYSNLLSQFETLTIPEILEKLGVCESSIENVLITDLSESNLYSIIITSIKEQIRTNISQVKELLSKPKSVTVPNKFQNSERWSNENSEFKNAVKNTEVKLKLKGLCDIAGLDNAKNILTTFIISPIKQPQLYNGLKFSNCILLFGPPGTGKTRLVNAVAAEANATLLSVTSSNLLSPYVGQSEKMLQCLFQYIYANDKQTVLFIDEIDGLCRCRTQNESEHSRRLKTEFMVQISNFEDSQKGFLICATNCPWELDTAFIRRFQKRIYIPLPNIYDRYSLFKLYTKDTPLEHTSDLWEPILAKTEGFSSSDIVQLIQSALTIPIIQLQQHKIWKFVDNQYYEALSSHDRIEGSYTIHFRNFEDLPPNSVRCRKVCFQDLMIALNDIKKTVNEDDVKKHESYITTDTTKAGTTDDDSMPLQLDIGLKNNEIDLINIYDI